MTSTPFQISDEAVEAVARVIYAAGASGGASYEVRDEYIVVARAVLSSPPVSEMVGKMKSLLAVLDHEDPWDTAHVRQYNAALKSALAALAPFTAEDADV